MVYQWAVIGAGPAGIAAIGSLLDRGVVPQDIAWIDPHFGVGDFGKHWRQVQSNTRVELFLKFLHACKAFNYKAAPADFALNVASPHATCKLDLMAQSLQWVSDQLKAQVVAITGFAERLALRQRVWTIKLNTSDVRARHVILSMGSDPKTLSLPHCAAAIPLQHALDSDSLSEHVNAGSTVAVFGSSHSAILALRNLLEHGVKQIINFYQQALMYAVDLDDWTLFDNTGLKGSTAEWARTYLHDELPERLLRVYANEENLNRYLPRCDKVIYAIGFERRLKPVVEGLDTLNYMEHSGIIAPGLFGLGIAFPQAKHDPLGKLEYRVGLWKFMDYLQQILPIWFKYAP